jgi:CRP-like cAMP-binding protein
MRQVLYLLGEFDDDDVEWLLATGVCQRVVAGAAIIDEGCPPDALFLVLDGTLVATTAALGGGELARLVRGTLAGEMSFVDELPPSATVRALGDSLVLAIPRAALSRRLGVDAVFAARFYRAVARLLSERLRASNRLLSGDSRPDLNERLQQPDELDVAGLDTVYLAGQRFERILRRLSDS